MAMYFLFYTDSGAHTTLGLYSAVIASTASQATLSSQLPQFVWYSSFCMPTLLLEQVHGVNCFTARWNWQGIAATAETRVPRDVAGQRLKIRFEIVDRRFGVLAGPVKEGEVDPNRVQRGPYTVYLTLQVSAMTSASCQVVVWHR